MTDGHGNTCAGICLALRASHGASEERGQEGVEQSQMRRKQLESAAKLAMTTRNTCKRQSAGRLARGDSLPAKKHAGEGEGREIAWS